MHYLLLSFLRGVVLFFWRIVGALAWHKERIIVFDSYMGKQYSCNPRAIYEYMLEHFPREGIRYVWAFCDTQQGRNLIHDPHTRICRYYSLKHLWYACIADVQITNFNFVPAEKRRQIRVETWHGGGCYKKVGSEIEYQSKQYGRYIQRKYNSITCFISSSRYFTDKVIREQFGYTGEVLGIGMPRNDLLLLPGKREEKAAAVRAGLEICADSFVVLYAPTYRDFTDKRFEPLDPDRLRQAVKNRFGREVVILYRGHHLSLDHGRCDQFINVNDYPDMQELLLISDMLISDYSSSIWDYSFTGRPCFLYAPDLAEYTLYRGFDVDIHEWGFPVCEDNASLENQILSFDRDVFLGSMQKHHASLGSYENGDASEKVCRFIADKLKIHMD